MLIHRSLLLLFIVTLITNSFAQEANFDHINSSSKLKCKVSKPTFKDRSVCPVGDSCISVLKVYREQKIYKDTFATTMFKDTSDYLFDSITLIDDGEYSFELQVMTLSDSIYKDKSTKTNLVQVYNPSNSKLSDENSFSTEEDSIYSYLMNFTVSDDFKPFDEEAWLYIWDFGDGSESLKTKNRNSEYFYSEERPKHEVSNEGYFVKLTITIDSMSVDDILNCSQSYTSEVEVRDSYFKSYEKLDAAPMNGEIEKVNTIILNSTREENRIFTFNVNGENWFEIYIFNSWGKQVEKIEGKKPIWDGRINNSKRYVAPGVYYYLIRSDAGDDRHESYGFIHVFDAEKQ